MTRTPCTVTFDGDDAYPAFDLGTTWNGFNNVMVMPETRDEMVRDIRAEVGADDETAAEMEALPINADGLIDLSNGWATQIVEPDEIEAPGTDCYSEAQLHAMGRVTGTNDADAEARGRRLFSLGAPFTHMRVAAMEDEPQYLASLERGWWDAHRHHYAEGAIAAALWLAAPDPKPEAPDSPYPQFSGAWEAWGDGYEATMHKEA